MTDSTTDTYQDIFPDTRVEKLIAQVVAINEDENSWTWLDQDPDVAWGCDAEESAIAKLRDVLIDAGWEKCYHRAGAILHYNVKLRGMDAWNGIREATANLPSLTKDRVDGLIQAAQDRDVEIWWQHELSDFMRYELDVSGKAWSCGQSGGYVNCSDLERDPESMIRLAQFLTHSVDGLVSREYGIELATRAIEEDQEIQMAQLASPRIERIEA